MMVNRAWETGLLFDHFTNNSWIYETLQVENHLKLMNEQEREEFFIDPKDIEWRQATK